MVYRDREIQLRWFLLYMIPLWQKQQLNFKIYVIEQSKDTHFNKARLYNIGPARKDIKIMNTLVKIVKNMSLVTRKLAPLIFKKATKLNEK